LVVRAWLSYLRSATGEEVGEEDVEKRVRKASELLVYNLPYRQKY
jgi:hypothetical protein